MKNVFLYCVCFFACPFDPEKKIKGKVLSNKKFLRIYSVLTFITTILIWSGSAFSQHHSSNHDKSVGKIDFKISSNTEAEDQFNYSLAMLHHMMYDHSEKGFRKVLEFDSNCAMAYWGIAMSYFHPLWYKPEEKDLRKGWEAVVKAKELNPPTEKEKDFISAIEVFFKDWKIINHNDRLLKWEDAQKKLFEKYPDDIDAGAFYALSLLTSAPKDDKNFVNQKKAGTILEQLKLKAPEHPGLFHYIIHAYDNPVLASRAVETARDYYNLTPDVPHALHMPSHIFVRLGLWPEVINWNIRSAASALKYSLQNETSHHYFHALDYLMYAYIQQAKDKKAEGILRQINEKENPIDALQSAYGIAASNARFFLERKKWKEAAALTSRIPSSFPWDKYPFCESIIYFARGLSAAHIGDIINAKNNLAKLNEMYENTINIGQDYWAVLVDVQRIIVTAWIAYSEGNKDESLNLMKKAADLEDSVDKHPVTPGAILPAREILGDMLLLLGKPEDALLAYETSLKISPNRFNSLYGAGYSAELSANISKAKHYYSELNNLIIEADSDRPELKQVKAFLAKHL